MPVFSARNLASLGIITDVSPYDLPLEAWTSGSNVRFADGKVLRAPVFRRAEDTMTSTEPAFVYTVRGTANTYDQVVIVDVDGRLWTWRSSLETDVTPAGFVPASSDDQFTGSYLQDVTYINRKNYVPLYKGPNDVTFLNLTNWDSTHRAHVLRAFRDYLVALGVDKSANSYPNLVKWSGIASTIGSPPPSWDNTDPTVAAGENTLSDLTSPLLDGLPLRNSMILYTADQVWSMDHIGGNQIFAFRPIWKDTGIINTNCVVEVAGRHYVFGLNDIWVHDGVEKQSIVDGRVRRHIFNTLDLKSKKRYFVCHNRRLSEIMFCYVTTHTDVAWPSTKYCNRAAVFNYVTNTWSFYDLPNVPAATISNMDSTQVWDTSQGTWTQTGGSWASLEGAFDPHLVFLGTPDTANGLTGRKILPLEPATILSTLAYPIDDNSNAVAWLEKRGMDLDTFGEKLSSYAVVTRAWPQVRFYGETSLLMRVGGQLYGSGDPKWTPYATIDPTSQYQIDVRHGGRYMSIGFRVPVHGDFEFSGLDFTAKVTGRR